MSGSGWRLPAFTVVVGLIVLVGVARLGMKGPSPAATAVLPLPSGAAPTLPARMSPQPSPGVVVVLQSPSELEFVYSPWPDRYADGVPRSFKQEDVYRLNAVLARAAAVAGTEQKVLIGGWLLEAKTSGCSDRRYEPWCTGMRLADGPTRLDSSVEVTDLPAEDIGPVVVSASVTAQCPGGEPWTMVSTCEFDVHGAEILWHGDDLTAASPLPVDTVLNAIEGVVFFDPVPFHPRLGCPAVTPAQTYTVDYGEVQLVAVFPTTADRRSHQAELTRASAAASPTAGCTALPFVNGSTTWVTQDNVMVRVIDYGGQASQMVRDLLRQLSQGAGK